MDSNSIKVKRKTGNSKTVNSNSKSIVKILIIFSLSIIGYLFFVEFLKEDTSRGDELFTKYDEVISGEIDKEFAGKSSTLPTERLDIYFQILSFDSQLDLMKIRLQPSPSEKIGEYGIAGKFIVNKPMRINIDSSKIEGDTDFDPNFYYGAIDIEVSGFGTTYEKRSNGIYFPFDEYLHHLFVDSAQISDDINVETADTNNSWRPLPIQLRDFSGSIDGYKIVYEYRNMDYESAKDFNEIDRVSKLGAGEIFINVSRDRNAIFSTFILLFFIIGASIALLAMSFVVYLEKRPPTLGSLVWGAASIFTIIETRKFIPNSPRVGVYMDLYLFFPALLICILATTCLFVLWIKRSDWIA